VAVKVTDNRFLFGFEGRINRAKYFYALLASPIFCLVSVSILAFAIGGSFGATVKSITVNILSFFNTPPSLPLSATFSHADPATAARVSTIFHVVATPIFVVGLWIVVAATIKRLHDRDKSGWWILVFFIAPYLLGKIVDALPDDSSVANIATYFLAFDIVGLNIWGTVELFVLQGTNGPNRFGPDPLTPASPGGNRASRWDQSSELEFVPYRASPSPGAHVKRGHD
jgi:uncharacterized membrane protein YhaH (DUF805 family)